MFVRPAMPSKTVLIIKELVLEDFSKAFVFIFTASVKHYAKRLTTSHDMNALF